MSSKTVRRLILKDLFKTVFDATNKPEFLNHFRSRIIPSEVILNETSPHYAFVNSLTLKTFTSDLKYRGTKEQLLCFISNQEKLNIRKIYAHELPKKAFHC